MTGVCLHGPNTTIESTRSAPDWDRVAFEVACGRCGERLNGVTKPCCPRCALALDWDSLLPLEDMRCLRCDYLVFGLNEPRCPECGASFNWEEVLRGARSRRNKLFEHHWFDNPVPALVRTWYLASVRPFKLWGHHDLSDPPRVGPLIAFVFLQWVVFAGSWNLVGASADWGMNHLSQWLDANVRFVYRFRRSSEFYPTLLTWYGATFLALQIFMITKRHYGVRWQQILRVFAHASALASLTMLACIIVEVAIDASLLVIPSLRGTIPTRFYDRVHLCILSTGLLAMWAHLWIGYRAYLRVPRGWGAATMAMLLGYLIACLFPWTYNPIHYLPV